MSRKIAVIARAGISVACLAASVNAAFAAPMVDLNGVGYVLYGDAQSYSLPAAIEEKCGGVAAGCQYSVDSTPGAIKDLVVVATGANGAPVNTNNTNQDNAYQTPSGVSGSIFFRPSTGTEYSTPTNGTVNNNLANAWDSSLSAMKSFLAGNQMVFFFNNNQTNSGGEATQSLAAWAQVWITDASNNIVGDVYQLTNRNAPYKLFTEGGGGVPLGDPTTYTNTAIGNPDAGDNDDTDYVLSGGAICYKAGLPISCSDPGGYDVKLPHNLGADHAAYAVLFPELNARLASLFGSISDAGLAAYTLHVDVRLGCDPSITGAAIDTICTGNDPTVPYGRSLNNGYEQLFIGSATPPVIIPEPSSLALAGLAFGVLGWRLRRRGTV